MHGAYARICSKLGIHTNSMQPNPMTSSHRVLCILKSAGRHGPTTEGGPRGELMPYGLTANDAL